MHAVVAFVEGPHVDGSRDWPIGTTLEALSMADTALPDLGTVPNVLLRAAIARRGVANPGPLQPLDEWMSVRVLLPSPSPSPHSHPLHPMLLTPFHLNACPPLAFACALKTLPVAVCGLACKRRSSRSCLRPRERGLWRSLRETSVVAVGACPCVTHW